MIFCNKLFQFVVCVFFNNNSLNKCPLIRRENFLRLLTFDTSEKSDGVCHLIKSSLSLLIQEHWSTLVEEDEQDVLEWAACVKQNLMVLCYLHHVKVRNVFTVVSCHKKKNRDKGRVYAFSFIVTKAYKLINMKDICDRNVNDFRRQETVFFSVLEKVIIIRMEIGC